MKLSVIIPVYQVEHTIDRCVESVASQNYSNMEIILVNDGSTDNSPAICNSWAEKDKRIRVIHKTNGGLSDARNAGINIATGNFITFVDSDDFVDNDVFDKLMNILSEHSEYDILEYSVRQTNGNNCKTLDLADYVYTPNQYWNEGKAYNHSYAWNKVYRKSLFDNVVFPKGKVFEDLWTLPLLTANSKVIATTCIGYYNYCLNPKGITATATGIELNMLLMAHMQLLSDKNLRMKDNADYYMKVVNIQMDVYELTGNTPLLKNKWISISKCDGYKVKAKAFTLNLLGINNLCKLNKLIHKITKCL